MWLNLLVLIFMCQRAQGFINAPDQDGNLPLHLALNYWAEEPTANRRETIRVLVKESNLFIDDGVVLTPTV